MCLVGEGNSAGAVAVGARVVGWPAGVRKPSLRPSRGVLDGRGE
jgi:hypothetical protein